MIWVNGSAIGNHAGDNYSLLFTESGASVTVSGKPIGTITQPQFAETLLAKFLGPKPASPRLKRELLQHASRALPPEAKPSAYDGGG